MRRERARPGENSNAKCRGRGQEERLIERIRALDGPVRPGELQHLSREICRLGRELLEADRQRGDDPDRTAGAVA